MAESEQNNQSDFMIEKIKERPVNKKKLIRRTATTAAMAVIFGIIACVTFLLLEPVISNLLHPKEEPVPIVFPEDQQEMAPEDMLSENNTPDNLTETEVAPLEKEQIDQILSKVVMNKNNYRQVYNDLSSFAAELNHSMVIVTGVKSDVDWFNNVEEKKNQSFGVIIANTGKELLILTESAPLKNAESLTLNFAYLQSAISGNLAVPAYIKGQDDILGMMVVSVNIEDIPESILENESGIAVAPLGASSARGTVGTPVIALGSPMGVSGSMSYGMITAVSPQGKLVDSNHKILLTDMYGSQNAGGILFNLQGQVMGVIYSPKSNVDLKNMITAMGISEMKKSIEKMSNAQPIGYLGISGIDVTEEANKELGVPFGAYVKETEMNSPAMRAGILPGDVLVALGDHNIRTYSDYISALMQTEVGTSAQLKVMRAAQGNYREMTIKVTVEER